MQTPSSNQPMVYPLFSSPVYTRVLETFDIPDISSLEFTNRLPTGGTHSFLTSTDKHILDKSEFADIREIIIREINTYAKGTLCISKRIEFYVTNSWININRPGDQCPLHNHNNSLISGVLYLKTPDKCGDLYFYRDILSLVPFPPSLDLETDSQNIFNCKNFSITPKIYQICLFPSVTMHSVAVNLSSEERWCLPFNVYVRGEIGGMHELYLK